MNGVGLKTVSELLAHAVTKTTERYFIFRPSTKRGQ
jgi:hypothetical protein